MNCMNLHFMFLYRHFAFKMLFMRTGRLFDDLYETSQFFFCTLIHLLFKGSGYIFCTNLFVELFSAVIMKMHIICIYIFKCFFTTAICVRWGRG